MFDTRAILFVLFLSLLRESCAANCSAGYFWNTTLVACSSCPVNFYCPGGILPALACPDKSSSEAQSSELSNCTCNAGFYTPVGHISCSLCPPGSFCHGSRTECPALMTSPGQSQRIQDCICLAGARPKPSGTGCDVCKENTFCPIGQNQSIDCPEHSYSLRGSSSTLDCQCLLPYFQLSSSVGIDCILFSDIDNNRDMMFALSSTLPTSSPVGLSSSITLVPSDLTEIQRDAIVITENIHCLNRQSLSTPCNYEIIGGVLNTSHGVLWMQNVALNPTFLYLFFEIFRDAKLTTSTYMQRREIWHQSGPHQHDQPGEWLQLDLSWNFHDAQDVQAFEQELEAFTVKTQALMYQNNSTMGHIRVSVQPQALRVPYAWWSLGDMALSCFLPFFSHTDHDAVIDGDERVKVPVAACPNRETLQCLQEKLPSSLLQNGVWCDTRVDVFYTLQAGFSEHVVGALDSAWQHHAQQSSPCYLNMFTVVTHYFSEAVVALSDPGVITEILFDSGIQSSNFWIVEFAEASLDTYGVLFESLFLQNDFNSTWRAWHAVHPNKQQDTHVLVLQVLGHHVDFSALGDSLTVSLTNPSDVVMQVSDYEIGQEEMLALVENLCLLSLCPSCDINVSQALLHVEGQVSSAQPLTGVDVKSVVCNHTTEETVQVSVDTEIYDCDVMQFTTKISMDIPLPPEIVSNFLLDAISSSIVVLDTQTHWVVESSPVGTMVGLSIPTSSKQECLDEDLIDTSTLPFLLTSIWPQFVMPQITRTCHFMCANVTVNTSMDHANEGHLTCVQQFEKDLTLPTTSLDVKATVDNLLQPFVNMSLDYTLSSELHFTTLCDSAQMLETFELLHGREYIDAAFAKTNQSLLAPMTAWGWSGHEKSACSDGNTFPSLLLAGCGESLTSSVKSISTDTCLEIMSQNQRFAVSNIQNWVGSHSSSLLSLGSQGIDVQSVFQSSSIWNTEDRLAEKMHLLSDMAVLTNLSLHMLEGFWAKHSFLLKWHQPFLHQSEYIAMETLKAKLLHKGESDLTWSQGGFLYFYTRSPLGYNTTVFAGVDFATEILSRISTTFVIDNIQIQNLQQGVLAQSPQLAMLSSTERLLINDPELEHLLQVSFQSALSCQEIQQIASQFQHLQIAAFDLDIYFLSQATECYTDTAMHYFVHKCENRLQVSIPRANVSQESCEAIANASSVQVESRQDIVFFQVLDILSESTPREAISFSQNITVCHQDQDMIQASYVEIGKFLPVRGSLVWVFWKNCSSILQTPILDSDVFVYKRRTELLQHGIIFEF